MHGQTWRMAAVVAAVGAMGLACKPASGPDDDARVDAFLDEIGMSEDDFREGYHLRTTAQSEAVEVTWRPPPTGDYEVTGYTVYRSAATALNGPNTSTAPALAANLRVAKPVVLHDLIHLRSTIYIDDEADPAGRYIYAVRAVRADGLVLPASSFAGYPPETTGGDGGGRGGEQPADGPDLVIENPVALDVYNSGDPINVRFDVANRGNEPAGEFDVEVYLALDGGVYDFESPWQTCSFGPLGPGEVVADQTCGDPGHVYTGFQDTLFFRVAADPDNEIAETDEYNNHAEASESVHLGGGGDNDDDPYEVPDPPGAPPGFAVESEPNDSVAGCQHLGAADARVYGLTGDSDYYCIDVDPGAAIRVELDSLSIGSQYYSYLEVYDGSGDSLSYGGYDTDDYDGYYGAALQGPAPGDGTLVVRLDDCCNDAGKTQWYHLYVTDATDLPPDLSLDDFDPTGDVYAGQATTVEYWIDNGGGAFAGSFMVAFTYDMDADGVVDAGEPEIGSCVVAGMAAFATTSGTCAITFPESAGGDWRYVVGAVDAGGHIAESEEANNTRFGGMSVAEPVPDQVDLIPDGGCCPVLHPGLPTPIDYEVFNRSTTDSPAFVVEHYLDIDDDGFLDLGYDPLLASCAHPPVSAMVRSEASCTVTVPAETPFGSYGTLVLADPANAVAEADDSNNNGSGSLIVGIGDFDGDGLDDPDEVSAGTDHLAADSDGDGYDDGLEVAAGSDPLTGASVPAMVAAYDFDANWQGWDSGGDNNGWHRTTTTSVQGLELDNTAAGTPGDSGTSGIEDSWLRSPALDLSGLDAAALRFRSYTYNEDCPYDEELVEAKPSGGSWTAVNVPCDAGGDQLNDTYGDGQWRSFTFDLSPWAGAPSVRVRFRFDSGDGCCGEDGWYVDDVAVYGE